MRHPAKRPLQIKSRTKTELRRHGTSSKRKQSLRQMIAEAQAPIQSRHKPKLPLTKSYCYLTLKNEMAAIRVSHAAYLLWLYRCPVELLSQHTAAPCPRYVITHAEKVIGSRLRQAERGES